MGGCSPAVHFPSGGSTEGVRTCLAREQGGSSSLALLLAAERIVCAVVAPQHVPVPIARCDQAPPDTRGGGAAPSGPGVFRPGCVMIAASPARPRATRTTRTPTRHTRRGGSAGWPKCVPHPARRNRASGFTQGPGRATAVHSLPRLDWPKSRWPQPVFPRSRGPVRATGGPGHGTSGPPRWPPSPHMPEPHTPSEACLLPPMPPGELSSLLSLWTGFGPALERTLRVAACQNG